MKLGMTGIGRAISARCIPEDHNSVVSGVQIQANARSGVAERLDAFENAWCRQWSNELAAEPEPPQCDRQLIANVPGE